MPFGQRLSFATAIQGLSFRKNCGDKGILFCYGFKLLNEIRVTLLQKFAFLTLHILNNDHVNEELGLCLIGLGLTCMYTRPSVLKSK